MFSVIMLAGILLGYVVLLICKQKYRSNYKLDGAVQFAQAVLWCLIAADNWNDNMATIAGKCINIMYVAIVVISVIEGVKTVHKRGQS